MAVYREARLSCTDILSEGLVSSMNPIRQGSSGIVLVGKEIFLAKGIPLTIYL
jgi:hypothetical protein